MNKTYKARDHRGRLCEHHHKRIDTAIKCMRSHIGVHHNFTGYRLSVVDAATGDDVRAFMTFWQETSGGGHAALKPAPCDEGTGPCHLLRSICFFTDGRAPLTFEDLHDMDTGVFTRRVVFIARRAKDGGPVVANFCPGCGAGIREGFKREEKA